MNIYVFAGTKEMKTTRKFGLDKSVAVFGWGWDSQFDLNSNGENPYYGKVRFLKNIKIGDKIIYVNYAHDKNVEDNHHGWCTMMNVAGEYEFNKEIVEKHGDFGHSIKIDPSSIYIFHRNSPSIHPKTSKSLKPMSAYQTIYDEEKFKQSIENHKKGNENPDYFESEIDKALASIIQAIQENHHDKSLEHFVKPLLEKIYTAKYKDVSIKVNGSGWKTDHGADLIIKYKENFGDLDLNVSSNKEYTVVAQVKSYKWSINDENAIEQCKTAIKEFKAEYAILITTAKISDNFNQKIEEHNSSISTSKTEDNAGMISLVDGEKLAKLYIKYIK